MKKSSHRFRSRKWKQVAVLLTGVSGIALLAGCGDTGFKNPFGSQRPDQMVAGERRMPLLNNGDSRRVAGQMPPPQPLVPAQMPAQAAPPAPVKADNYDYYSAERPPQDPAGGRLLGTLNPAPVKAESPVLRVRKPLPGNIQHEALGAAPVTTPAAVAAPAPPPTYSAGPGKAFDASVAEPVAEKTAAPVKKASFFERVFGSSDSTHETSAADDSSPPWKKRDIRSSSGTEINEAEPAPEPKEDTPYPALSSVPSRPAQFDDVKGSREQDMQQLQRAHSNAQQEKYNLVNEPSQQQQKVSPVEMPQPAPETSSGQQVLGHASAPVEVPPAQTVSPPETSPAPEASDTPRSPRRGIDIMTQEEWEALQKSRLQGQSAAPAEAQSAPVNAPPPGWAPEATPLQAPPVQESPPAAQEQPQESAPAPAQPQSALPSDAPVVAAAAPRTELKTVEVSEVGTETSNVTTTENAGEKRSSFFSRLFGQSPKQVETDSASADADASSAKETAVSSDAQPEWVRNWLTKPPSEPQADEVKTFLPELKPAAGPVQEPAQIMEEEKKPEPVAATEAPKEDTKEADSKSSARDWLQSLVSDAQAQPEPVAEKSEIADEQLKLKAEKEAEAKAAAMLPPPVEPVQGDGPQLIGQITDKTMMKLVDQPKDTKTVVSKKESLIEPKLVDLPTEGKPVAEASPAAGPEVGETPEKEDSFFSRLFTRDEKIAQPVETVASAPEPIVVEKPDLSRGAPASVAEKPVLAEEVDPDAPKQPFLDRLFLPSRAVHTESVMVKPAEKSAVADVAPEESKSSLLGSLFAPSAKTTEAEKPVETKEVIAEKPEPAPEPQAPVVAETPAPAASEPVAADVPSSEPGQQKPSFFSRLLGGEKKKDEEKTETADDGKQPVVAVPLISSAAPVTQVTTGDTELKQDAAAGATPTSLPSPKILKEIKMMPASRYSARRQAEQKQQEY